MIKVKVKALLEQERKIEYFLGEIKRQCEYVFLSEDMLNASLADIDMNSCNKTSYAIQNMFTALGNISKILYPTAKYRIRGKLLRKKLGINDNTQFFYDSNSEVARKYRNILEHYDEYFEDWYNKGENNIISECNVGSKNIFIIGNKTLRHYDPQYNKFIFLDDEYNLTQVMKETKEIYTKIINIEGERFGYTKSLYEGFGIHYRLGDNGRI